MKSALFFISFLTLAGFTAPLHALAQEAESPALKPPPAIEAGLDAQIDYLQTNWALIKYKTPDKEQQIQAISVLEENAARIAAAFPDKPGPKIWQATILSTHASIVRGMSVLGKVKQAKSIFEKALRQDETALDGQAHTILGSLYYQVPGWPIAFGNHKKAEDHLKRALEINPDNIDANYFYGDFLMEEKRYDAARKHLEKAVNAPARTGRAVADAGRRQEAKDALKKLQELKDSNVPEHDYN